MWSEEYQAALIRGYLEVAARKDYRCRHAGLELRRFRRGAGHMRVGGMNMKGVFTRTRTPKMAAHMLREYWARPAAADA